MVITADAALIEPLDMLALSTFPTVRVLEMLALTWLVMTAEAALIDPDEILALNTFPTVRVFEIEALT